MRAGRDLDRLIWLLSNLAALSSRFLTATRSRSALPSTVHGPRSASNSVFGQSATGGIEGIGHHRVEPDLGSLRCRGSPLARSVTLTTRRLSSSTWSATRVRTSLRCGGGHLRVLEEQVGVDAEAGERGPGLVARWPQPPLASSDR